MLKELFKWSFLCFSLKTLISLKYYAEAPLHSLNALFQLDLQNLSFPGHTFSCHPEPWAACNVGDAGLIPGLGRSPGERKWQPTPVCLPGKSRGQSSLVDYSSRGCRVGHDWATNSLWTLIFHLYVGSLRMLLFEVVEGGVWSVLCFCFAFFSKKEKGIKRKLAPRLSILGTVKTCFLHFICKEKHSRSEYTQEHPQFLQERRQWCWIPGRIEKDGCFFASFPPYLFLISFTLCSSPSSLFLSSLIFPFGFESFPFTPFVYFLTGREKTVTPFRDLLC